MSEKQQTPSPMEPESGARKHLSVAQPEDDDAEGHGKRHLMATPTDDGDENATDTEGHEKK